jgi:hypothetical protein
VPEFACCTPSAVCFVRCALLFALSGVPNCLLYPVTRKPRNNKNNKSENQGVPEFAAVPELTQQIRSAGMPGQIRSSGMPGLFVVCYPLLSAAARCCLLLPRCCCSVFCCCIRSFFIFIFLTIGENIFFTFRMCLVGSGTDSHSFRVPFIPATVDSRFCGTSAKYSWHSTSASATKAFHSYEVGMYRCMHA